MQDMLMEEIHLQVDLEDQIAIAAVTVEIECQVAEEINLQRIVAMMKMEH